MRKAVKNLKFKYDYKLNFRFDNYETRLFDVKPYIERFLTLF